MHEKMCEKIIDTCSIAYFAVDERGCVVHWNKQSETLFGWQAEEILGENIYRVLIPDKQHARARHSDYFDNQSDERFRKVEHMSIEVPVVCKDGTRLDIELIKWKTEFDGTVLYSVLARNIESRKRAERIFEEAHLQNKRLLDAISMILIEIDASDRVIRWNKAAERAFGVSQEELLGKQFIDSGIDWDWSAILEQLADSRWKDEQTVLNDVQFRNPEGKDGYLTVAINPIFDDHHNHSGFLLLATDITEKKILEMQLQQAQKLESIGQLAAGVAHEINTPIQYIGYNIDFLKSTFEALREFYHRTESLYREQCGDGRADTPLCALKDFFEDEYLQDCIKEAPDALEQSLTGVNQVTRIVSAMKEFSHPGTVEKTAINLNDAIRNTLIVARNEYKYVAEVVTDLDESLPPVPCMPGELNQVLLNLIINAAHAIAEVVGDDATEKGTITIRTRHKGDNVAIAISDTGCGIPDEISSRIFDPFFTTKEVGKGTGQGLAIAHDVIVEKHNGSITFESQTGKGTTFHICLPLESDLAT